VGVNTKESATGARKGIEAKHALSGKRFPRKNTAKRTEMKQQKNGSFYRKEAENAEKGCEKVIPRKLV